MLYIACDIGTLQSIVVAHAGKSQRGAVPSHVLAWHSATLTHFGRTLDSLIKMFLNDNPQNLTPMKLGYLYFGTSFIDKPLDHDVDRKNYE